MSSIIETNFNASKAIALRACEVGLVPLINGAPGVGKSALVKEIAAQCNLVVIDYRLSTAAPEDFNGLPFRGENGKAAYLPFDTFPLEGDALPPGKNGWLLFLDELTSGGRTIQAAAYKLILDRLVGNAKLHEAVFIIGAGNRAEDNAIVNSLSTALQSRMIQISMVLDAEETLGHMIQKKYDQRVLGFLEFDRSNISNFDPQHSEKTFACPRTWEFVSRMIDGMPTDQISLPMLASCVGEGMAAKLFTFVQDFGKVPSYASIVANPKTVVVSGEAGPRYATIAMLMNSMQVADIQEVMTYIGRVPMDMQVLFSRGALRRMPKLRHHPDFVAMTAKIAKFMESKDDDIAA